MPQPFCLSLLQHGIQLLFAVVKGGDSRLLLEKRLKEACSIKPTLTAISPMFKFSLTSSIWAVLTVILLIQCMGDMIHAL